MCVECFLSQSCWDFEIGLSQSPVWTIGGVWARLGGAESTTTTASRWLVDDERLEENFVNTSVAV